VGNLVRPLHRVIVGVWESNDRRFEFCRHESDPHPRRWFIFEKDAWIVDERPGASKEPYLEPWNEGEGHITLRECVDWLERELAREASASSAASAAPR